MLKSNKLKDIIKNTLVLIDERNFIGSGYFLINKIYIDDVQVFQNELKLAQAKNNIINLQTDETMHESVETLYNDINCQELKKIDNELLYSIDIKTGLEVLKIGENWYNKKFLDIFLKNSKDTLYYKQKDSGLLAFCNNDGIIMALLMSINK